MSLAWTTLAVVVLLLPGILFFFGLFIPEKFTRDVAPRNALGELGAAVFVAFFVHGAAFLLLTSSWNTHTPTPSIEVLLGALHLSGDRGPDLAEIAENLSFYSASIVGYLFATNLVGALLGALTGWLIVLGPLRRLARHKWVYDLIDDDPGNLTLAYILTTVQNGPHVLMYRGYLSSFALAPDGRFSYLVLKECYRYLMDLSPPSPATSQQEDWLEIGANSGIESSGSSTVSNVLVIEGEDIANVVFDRVRVTDLVSDRTDLENAIEDLASAEASTQSPPSVDSGEM
jgi:hypothetical protein